MLSNPSISCVDLKILSPNKSRQIDLSGYSSTQLIEEIPVTPSLHAARETSRKKPVIVHSGEVLGTAGPRTLFPPLPSFLGLVCAPGRTQVSERAGGEGGETAKTTPWWETYLETSASKPHQKNY